MLSKEAWTALNQFEDRLTNPEQFTDKQLQNYRREMCLAMFMEMAELVDSFQWKTWKPRYWVNKENAMREAVDIVVFLHHVMRSFEITEEDLERKFWEVMQNNIRRHIEGKEDLLTEWHPSIPPR